jgi:hypothetical protein
MATVPEWRSFATSAVPGVDDCWEEFTGVWHYTHMMPAVRIAEDQQISGRLIYDGKLLATRTEVAYLSPKQWGGGSIYGSFCFEASWPEIHGPRKLYWVEENRSYQNPIARFLLSWNDMTRLPVTPYDPTTDDGPLRLVGDKWYWLKTCVPEIVIDDPVPFSALRRLTFDSHRQGYCHHTKSRSCSEMDAAKRMDVQTSFVARLVGGGAIGLQDLMVDGDDFAWGVRSGFTYLWLRLFKGHSWDGPIADDVGAADLIAGACLTYHAGDVGRAKRLMALIDTEERAERIFRDMIRKRFDFPTFDWE